MSSTINQMFADFPTKSANYVKNINSLSGKSEAESVVRSNINVFLQPTSGLLREGILPGTYLTIFVDAAILAPYEVEYGDAFIIGNKKMSVSGIELFDFGKDVAPFYELTLESVKNPAI